MTLFRDEVAGGVDRAAADRVADDVDLGADVAETSLDIRGPFDLEELALMGFGHRNERAFDNVMRLAFCVDGDYQRQVGVEVRQVGARLDLRIHRAPGSVALNTPTLDVIEAQVARVLSVDHDGAAFHRMCEADPVLARVHALAPGFRPVQFYSPYEAAVWSILSARRARGQAMAIREKIGRQLGASFELAGVSTVTVPTPSVLLQADVVPGLAADRVSRLQTIATAAQEGRLTVQHLLRLGPEAAMTELRELPGIGPFYSALIVIRACGVADVLPSVESHSRDAVRLLYGYTHDLDDAELESLAEGWRPWRTWVAVMVRALTHRLPAPEPHLT
ncbi:MAG TPA: hypothetical protein VF635_15990 [Propionibacteriaceae bacterium]